SGAAKLTAQKQVAIVAQGFGSKADPGSTPTPPRPLPSVPEWVDPPPAAVFSAAPADVRAQYRPGTGPGPAAVRWHVQLSRDASFDDLVVDAFVSLDVTHLEARGLAGGRYFARVSAVDADAFEGPSTAASPVVVTPLVVRSASSAGGQAAFVEVPAGLFCAVGEGALTATDHPLAFVRGPARRLRCAADAGGRSAIEATIPVQGVGPLRAEASLEPTGRSTGVVHLRLADAAGAPLEGTGIEARPVSGGDVQSVASRATPGTFDLAVHWVEGSPSLRLRITANGVDAVDLPELPLPAPPLAPAPRIDHVAMAVLAGAAVETGPYPTRPGSGPAVAGEIGWLHSFDRWGLELAVRGSWEHAFFSRPSSEYLADDLYTVGLPVVVRYGGRGAEWTPYVGIGPELVLDYVGSTAQPLGFGGSASVGLARRAGDLGEVILQLGYRLTTSFEDYGNGRRDALGVQLGYRLIP
ncbi:MAG TPA: hypothetical protein VIF09_16785, partial [Polyangiaceae bacterium]